MLTMGTRRFTQWTLLALCAGLLACLSWLGLIEPTTVHAQNPIAITLLYFEATGLDGAVLLEWATATEFETAGFRVKRALAENGPYNILDHIGFIPAIGGGIGGAEYSALDDTVTNGITYWYRLVEVEISGNENDLDPISVVPGPPTPTPTASATSPPGTTPDTPTATPSPTATATATQPSGGNGNNPPTATPTRTPSGGQSQPTSTTRPGGPSATPRPGSTAQPTTTGTGGGTNSTPQAVGQVPTATTASGYPAPPSETLIPPPDAADPGQDGYPLLPSSPTPIPYPGQGSPPPTQPGDVLDNTPQPGDLESQPSINLTSAPRLQPTQPPLDQQQPTESEDSNTFLLWVAFVAALLVFGAAAVGSIVLFTRQGRQEDSKE